MRIYAYWTVSLSGGISLSLSLSLSRSMQTRGASIGRLTVDESASVTFGHDKLHGKSDAAVYAEKRKLESDKRRSLSLESPFSPGASFPK